MKATLNCVIVDDDPDWLALIERMVRKSEPHTAVVSFTRPLQALDYLHRTDADVLIADLVMPELNGLLLVEAVRQFDDKLPIVMTSIHEFAETEALAIGASAFVAKAALPVEIGPTLQRVIARAGRTNPTAGRGRSARQRSAKTPPMEHIGT